MTHCTNYGSSITVYVMRVFNDVLRLLDVQGYVLNATRPQNLGVIVQMLTQCTNQFLTTFDGHKQQMRKYNNIAELSGEELKEVSSAVIGD